MINMDLLSDVGIAIVYFAVIFIALEIRKVGFKKAVINSVKFVKNFPSWIRREAF